MLDLDIKNFFGEINWELLMRAVRHHTDCAWVLLYIERWLKAPVQMPDGAVVYPDKGTPQGGVVSPLLANLFLHYAFDRWMQTYHSDVPFERYADDGICHCKSEAHARQLRQELEERLTECGLRLHPEKTKVVYCKDDDRRAAYLHHSFDFLGYTFRPRRSKNRWGKYFVNFSPAVSNRAAKGLRQELRSWALQNRSDKSLEDLARMLNPMIQGWMQYYGRFYRSALYPTLRHVDECLVWWATRKYKKLRRHFRRARHWLARIAQNRPKLFAHWRFMQPTAG